MANIVANGVRNFLIFHVSLTATHCLYSSFSSGFLDDDDEAESLQPSRSTVRKADKYYKDVSKLVSTLYSEKHIDRNAPLHEDVEFWDPLAICYGRAEVTDCFNALAVCKPEQIKPPKCIKIINSVEDSDLTHVTYLLHLKYFGSLTVRSLLIVDVLKDESGYYRDNSKTKKVYERRVTKIQECWNGVPLFDSFLFFIPRRLNGYASVLAARQFYNGNGESGESE